MTNLFGRWRWETTAVPGRCAVAASAELPLLLPPFPPRRKSKCMYKKSQSSMVITLNYTIDSGLPQNYPDLPLPYIDFYTSTN